MSFRQVVSVCESEKYFSMMPAFPSCPVISDAVNLAARLEGANKTYGTKSLITETVYEKIKDSFLCREIDLMTVKGKTHSP